MDVEEIYRVIQFDRPRRTVPRRLIPIGIGLVIFTLLWVFVPPRALYWLLLPLVTVLLWMASYSWRRVLTAIHKLIHRVDQM